MLSSILTEHVLLASSESGYEYSELLLVGYYYSNIGDPDCRAVRAESTHAIAQPRAAGHGVDDFLTICEAVRVFHLRRTTRTGTRYLHEEGRAEAKSGTTTTTPHASGHGVTYSSVSAGKTGTTKSGRGWDYCKQSRTLVLRQAGEM